MVKKTTIVMNAIFLHQSSAMPSSINRVSMEKNKTAGHYLVLLLLQRNMRKLSQVIEMQMAN